MGPTGLQGSQGIVGFQGNQGSGVIFTYANSTITLSFSMGTNIVTGSTTTAISRNDKLFIQGYNLTSGQMNVLAVIDIYASQGATFWNINLRVRATGPGGGSYQVYYYGLS
jgi:hypothetical protein